MIGGFTRTNYLFAHDRGREFRMPANLDINTACVDVRLVQNPSLVRGGARGRGQDTGPATESAVLFRMLPGVETVVGGVDGVACCGIDGCGVLRAWWVTG